MEKATEDEFHGKFLSRKIRIKIVRCAAEFSLEGEKSDCIKHSHSHRSSLDIKDTKSTESVSSIKTNG